MSDMTNQTVVYKFEIQSPVDSIKTLALQDWLTKIPGMEKVDVNFEKSLIRTIGSLEITEEKIKQFAAEKGIILKSFESGSQNLNPARNVELKVGIIGMHCRSCELLIENEFENIPGVQKVKANADLGQVRLVCDSASLPSRKTLNDKLVKHGYHLAGKNNQNQQAQDEHQQKPKFSQLVGAFLVVIILGYLLAKLGLLQTNKEIDGTAGFFAIFILGLIAASSSCIAVSGGLLLSVVERVSDRYKLLPGRARMLPVGLFVIGRIIGYTVFGAMVAGIGKALSPSALVTGLIAIAAALFMFVMGLDMLHIAPKWLKLLMPRMPKFLGHKVLGDNQHNHYFSPAVFGALTFFLPCGFTQALQLYVLSTGNIWTGALVMFAFALGTAPALLALGWASNALKGKAGQIFFRFAGAAVIVLGLYNFNNGLTLVGHPIILSSFSKSVATENSDNAAADQSVTQDGDVQVVKTSFTASGYSPSTFTVKAGQPVRWEVDGAGYSGGCRSFLQIPKLNMGKAMASGINVIEFTPAEAGTYTFSCGMGMYRSSFTVINS
ncbi:MAG: hypothetical protein COT26_01525 [Candidatus Kerfeldbacteria bacterium CG08_land_8_20_14_0_20_43_14]|uniref:HMA domain-containing protein n=1 Tax=Candidatus Kerfeldbacteria bacterium CG08_land_8_20_14_0_20_43_14 TaxID=2014246 RepID=A0A2H0YQK5_9BACT|nr:MAG: hypothetical protein COT26_01525 [Candidatus Kerfeldbacteria bacterium CG08_land_8_20_14_0_20_43_14]